MSFKTTTSKRLGASLLVTTVLGGFTVPAVAQTQVAPATEVPTAPPEVPAPATEVPAPQAEVPAPPAEVPAPAPATTPPANPATASTAPVNTGGMIRSVTVRGAERLEAETVRQYANLTPGVAYTRETLDQAIKDLYATELFADAQITGTETGNLVIQIRENPVINRIVLEGNKRIKDDKITPEIKLSPRQIFTRTKARADVERIIELYKRQGRFGARVEPKVVQLDQNRVDVVFEITEGDRSKVRAINIIGNEAFADDRLRKEMYTRQSGGLLGFMKSNDSYDPDRLAADQQKLRAYYLTQGYADFRVVSALAELTPDRRDFVITYVVEEGPRYKFGKISAESELRDLKPEAVTALVNMKQGDWFNAKLVEDSVTRLNETAGQLGYAFSDINPNYERNAETKTMDITFRVGDTPRVYVERIDIQGNTVTRDKVVRREFRVNEGDAFNATKVRRSQDRIQSLGYFQEKLEIKQTQGSAPDRVVLGVDVEEKSTGQLQVSAGYSSLERFIISLSVAQNNFRGMGQELNAGVNYSQYSKSVELGFTEPYLFDRQILLGGSVYRRDYSSFNYVGNARNTTYKQVTTGAGLRLGFPVNEFVNVGTRYTLYSDKLTLDRGTFYTGGVCDPTLAGQYLCDEIGTRLTSSIGASIAFDNTDGLRPTRGQRLVFSQDFAGLGGDVKYLRSQADVTKYIDLGRGLIFSAHAEGGYIHSLQKARRVGQDPVRITDRFFGPSPSLRGFDIRGIGPRVRRTGYDATGALVIDTKNQVSDALGGHAYYMARGEVQIPLSSGLKSLGLRPSVFVDVGSVFGLRTPTLVDNIASCIPLSTAPAGTPGRFVNAANPLPCNSGVAGETALYTSVPGYREEFLGNSPKPRLSIGIGVNWNSPFGPLRIDLAKALLKQEGDEPKLFSFNVGTQF